MFGCLDFFADQSPKKVVSFFKNGEVKMIFKLLKQKQKQKNLHRKTILIDKVGCSVLIKALVIKLSCLFWKRRFASKLAEFSLWISSFTRIGNCDYVINQQSFHASPFRFKPRISQENFGSFQDKPKATLFWNTEISLGIALLMYWSNRSGACNDRLDYVSLARAACRSQPSTLGGPYGTLRYIE